MPPQSHITSQRKPGGSVGVGVRAPRARDSPDTVRDRNEPADLVVNRIRDTADRFIAELARPGAGAPRAAVVAAPEITTVDVPLLFEAGKQTGQVSFDQYGQVVGPVHPAPHPVVRPDGERRSPMLGSARPFSGQPGPRSGQPGRAASVAAGQFRGHCSRRWWRGAAALTAVGAMAVAAGPVGG